MKRKLSKQELEERIVALRPYRSGAWGTFKLDDGSTVIRTAHIDRQVQRYEELLETADPDGFYTAYRVVNNSGYDKGYHSGYVAGRRAAPKESV